MAAQNLLVVLLSGGSRSQLRRAVEEYGDDWPTVHVVAPARVGALDWLASAEDDARVEADARALEAEWLLADEAEVEAEAGYVDPVQAVEDALRSFPAEEILLIGGAGENGALESSLREFGLPVKRVGAPARAGRPSSLRQLMRQITAGRSKATPFIFFVAVNLFLLIAAAVISAIVLLILWLS